MKSISPQQELDQWPSTMLQYSCPSSPSSSPRTPPPTSSSCCPTRRPGCCWSTPPSPSRRRPQCPHQGGLVAWSWKGSWTRPAPFPWWLTSSAVEYREPCVADIIVLPWKVLRTVFTSWLNFLWFYLCVQMFTMLSTTWVIRTDEDIQKTMLCISNTAMSSSK